MKARILLLTAAVAGGAAFGLGLRLVGGIALGVIMIPIVLRTTEEQLKMVPASLREAALALGVPFWRTSLKVTLRSALPGVVTGVLLAIARVAGETAPLLFTIGVISKVNANPFHGTNTSLSQEIWNNSQTPFPAAHDRAWGAALTLIFLVFVSTM